MSDQIIKLLEEHFREMDKRITMKQIEIKMLTAAVGQLEDEKWRIEKILDKAKSLTK